MPSTSAKQRRFMAAAANDPEFARRAGIDRSVAEEFHSADKKRGRKKRPRKPGYRKPKPPTKQLPIRGGKR